MTTKKMTQDEVDAVDCEACSGDHPTSYCDQGFCGACDELIEDCDCAAPQEINATEWLANAKVCPDCDKAMRRGVGDDRKLFFCDDCGNAWDAQDLAEMRDADALAALLAANRAGK